MAQSIDRRALIQGGGAVAAVAGAGALLGSPASPARASGGERHRPHRKLKMYVGTQRRATTAAVLKEFTRHGVTHWVGYPPTPPLAEGRGYWLPSEVEQIREFAEQHGVTLDMVALPFLTSSHIDRDSRPAIMLGKSPERDRDIDDIHKMIEACAIAGVPGFKYNMSLLGVLRTGEVPGRGGSVYGQFRAADFNIHLRNIIGRRDDFMEVWPDEGDIDHARIIRILAEEGYSFIVDPDHVPDHPDDPGGKQAYAHGYGYLHALMQAVEASL